MAGVGIQDRTGQERTSSVPAPGVSAERGVQFRRELAGLPYAEQVRMTTPQAPLQMSRNVTPGEAATVDTRLGSNGRAATVEDKHGSRATDAGVIAVDGHSMAAPDADNPHFEEDASAFERALGPAAHGHGSAAAVMSAAAGKVKTYLEELTGTWDARTKDLRDLLKKCGSDDRQSSNRVGTAAGAIKQLVESGTVGERCGMVEKFWQNIVLPEFLKAPADADVAARRAAGQAALDQGLISGRVEGKSGVWYFYAKQDESTTDHTDPAAAAQQLEARQALNWQWHTRAPRPSDQTLDKMKVGDVEGVISRQEKLFQGVSAASDELAWSNGENAWMMNEYDKWVFAQRQMALPLVAGPSGTTDRLFQTLGAMGVADKIGIRTACIGYLLPPRHHSLVEVLTAAAAHGVPFTPGKRMYTVLPPFSETELKGFGGGKFPHEPRP